MTISPAPGVAFLLGSGASIPAGMPSTLDLTERILSGEGVARHTDATYHLGRPLYAHMGLEDEFVPRIVSFFDILKEEITPYYCTFLTDYRPNYEDLYYVSNQVLDTVTGEYDNPAVQPFIERILPRIQPLLIGKAGEIRERWSLGELAREAIHYIHDVVWCKLSMKPKQFDHLRSVRDACEDRQVSRVDLFTLNHDTVLEQYLSQDTIQFTDGFGEPVHDVRYWDPNLLENPSIKVRVLKLHGSVNWFRLRPDGGGWSEESIGISLKGDPDHTKSREGLRQLSVEGRPKLLVGTFNKMLSYISGIHMDLHAQFHRSLPRIKGLVVCGYSFGDRGINTRIIEWMYAGPDRNMTIVHPDPGELKSDGRSAFVGKWEELEAQGKLRIIREKIEGANREDIRRTLGLAG
ncbi:MAG: SIR2 family protein [Armatimonadetes bacterium]|nr:SIR2 family protein [Armatimonadota bacterium]